MFVNSSISKSILKKLFCVFPEKYMTATTAIAPVTQRVALTVINVTVPDLEGQQCKVHRA